MKLLALILEDMEASFDEDIEASHDSGIAHMLILPLSL